MFLCYVCCSLLQIRNQSINNRKGTTILNNLHNNRDALIYLQALDLINQIILDWKLIKTTVFENV